MTTREIQGARMSFVSVTEASLGTDSEASVCDSSTGRHVNAWRGLLTADISASGANGLDTGSEAASTIYFLFVIADTSGANAPASLLSLSATSPTLPSGYNVFRRLGAVFNDSTSDLLRFHQTGAGRDRAVEYDIDLSETQVLNAGGATTFTNVDLSTFVPSTSEACRLHWLFDPNVSGRSFNLRPDGFANASQKIKPGIGGSTGPEGMAAIACPGQLIEYQVSGTGAPLTLDVYGYTDEL